MSYATFTATASVAKLITNSTPDSVSADALAGCQRTRKLVPIRQNRQDITATVRLTGSQSFMRPIVFYIGCNMLEFKYVSYKVKGFIYVSFNSLLSITI